MDKSETPALEEIMRDRQEHKNRFVEYLHDVANVVDKHLDIAIEDYRIRVIYQEALLLVLSELKITSFNVSKRAVDIVKDTYVGKRVNIVNEVNEDGSRTIKLSVSEIENG